MTSSREPLCEALLAYLVALKTPTTGAGAIEGYVQANPGAFSGDVRLALLRLLTQKRVSIGRDWQLSVCG